MPEIEDPDTFRAEGYSDSAGATMTRLIQTMAAAVLVISACGASDVAEAPSTQPTSSTAVSLSGETTTRPPSATLPSTSTPTMTSVVVTTTYGLSTTSTVTTTVTPIEVNPPDVEAWWCDAFERAGDQNPDGFALWLTDDFRNGYSTMPAESLEAGANQAALVRCDPEYGQAVAEALGVN